MLKNRVVSCILVTFLFSLALLSAQEPGQQLIWVHLKSRALEFFENDQLIFTFPVRVGKSETPTPEGEGFVNVKRKRPVFRYVDPGPKQGQIVEITECASGIRPMP